MGQKVHVIKKMAEYGSDGFNWRQQEFKSLLDDLGCDTNGSEYSDQFDCLADSFERALNLIKTYKEKGECDEVKEFLEDVGTNVDDLDNDLCNLGDIDNVIDTMQSFLDTRDKSSDYIMFECW